MIGLRRQQTSTPSNPATLRPIQPVKIHPSRPTTTIHPRNSGFRSRFTAPSWWSPSVPPKPSERSISKVPPEWARWPSSGACTTGGRRYHQARVAQPQTKARETRQHQLIGRAQTGLEPNHALHGSSEDHRATIPLPPVPPASTKLSHVPSPALSEEAIADAHSLG